VIEDDVIKFEGEFQGTLDGVAATIGILAIGDETYMKAFTPDYEPVDLATLGVPNPTAFFDPETGVASLLAATTDLAEGEEVREGSEILREITGTLPGESVEALLNLGGPGRSFDVAYGLTEDNELRTAELRGEFWEGSTSVYTMLLTDYGQVVTIEAPTS
jgi:lipoprotein LprG